MGKVPLGMDISSVLRLPEEGGLQVISFPQRFPFRESLGYSHKSKWLWHWDPIIVILALFLSCSYTDKEALSMEKRFYDFKKGTEWVFNADFNGVKRMVVFKVVKQDSNGTHFEYDIYNPPDPGATASLDEIWYVKDGYVVWADYDLEQVTPYWRVYKLGSNKGDTWKGPSEKGEATHMGTTELAVPAGRYKDVIHIRLTDQDDKMHNFYYAPKVGLVKWETTSSSGKAVLELQTFKEGE